MNASTDKQLLTHSRMQSFKSCRKKHYFEYEIGFRRVTDSKALRMGTAGHSAVDVIKKGGELEQALMAVASHYQDPPEGADAWEWQMEQETVESLVTGYHWRWGRAGITIIESEKAFRLPLVNPETNSATPLWDVAGKIDGIIEMDGRLLVLEHKFVSDPIDQDSDYWRRLALDSQISVYTWAARSLGYNVSGVLYDVIRKPTIRPELVPRLDEHGLKIVLDAHGDRVMKKDNTPRQTGDLAAGYVLQTRPQTSEEWSQKLLADIGERPDHYYQRIEIARLDQDIEEMQHEMWSIQKTIREAQLNQRWFKTVSRDTCSYCPFFGLCTSSYQHIPGGIAPEGFVHLANLHPELETI